jgi:DNA-binding transcriptional LysR family regulator
MLNQETLARLAIRGNIFQLAPAYNYNFWIFTSRFFDVLSNAGKERRQQMLPKVFDLDLRLMRIFVALVDAGGVSAAQPTLNMSQSTISTHLATLEARLGFRLCERGRSGFHLTPKGTKFVDSSRHLLATMNEFSVSVRNMDRKLVGTLNVGLIDHLPVREAARISKAIARFGRRDQAVKFSIVVRSPRDLEEGLLNGEIQIAVGYFWHRVPNLEYRQMFVEHQIACCGREHPMFSRAGKVTPEEASEQEWAWRSYPLPEARQSTSRHRVTAVADDMGAVAVLVMSGRHLAYLPEHFASPYIEGKLMVPLNPSVLKYDVPFHMTTSRSASRNDVLQAFLEDLQFTVPNDTSASIRRTESKRR